VEGRWRDSLLARIRLETAWPLASGNITNDDWLSVPSSNDPEIHSDSTGYLKYWLHGELELGFPEGRQPSHVETLFGLTIRQMSWEGWDAYQVSGIPEYSVGAIPGYVIDYRQTWLIPWMGLNIGSQKPASAITASIRFSPWMHVVGRDVHMARPVPATFIDVMSGGMMFSGGLGGKVRLSGKLWLTGKLSFDYCSGARGDTYVYEVGNSTVSHYANTGGVAFSLFSTYLGISTNP
jgi:outer membrane protease